MSITNPSLRSRIYFSMVIMILVSMLVTGIFTIYHFKAKNDVYHEKRLSRQEERVIATIQYFLKDSELQENLNTYIKDFADKILEIADVNNLEINVFNTSGEILMSSQIEIEDPNFYLQTISDSIFTELKRKEHVVIGHVQGDTKFLSTYSYVKNRNGNNICIVNLPYSRSDAANKSEVSEFLTSLIVVYAAMLIGVILLAYLLSNYITKSLRVIKERFKSVGINKKNEPIYWKGSDEIGSLVAEYNHMVTQLEFSAEKLAKSERESAWREMAKQVAHEIKNPLTPMKLSVQHLQRSFDPDDPDFKERMASFSDKMIRQIDTLSTIANEFSNFAKMPKANIGEINIIKLVNEACELFSETENLKLNFTNNTGKEVLTITGDNEQLTRVFNNLIKNGIQAIPNERKGEIIVVVEMTADSVIIQVKDNGIGISKDKKEQIFVPNFTTKSSGSGLGLAMVKSIIENHQGSVWFETIPPTETSFFVSLPMLTNQKDELQ
ncbi:MAG: GHKL domain-containing protein [Crocinitomicaceae bacterium]|nr:GHKL domain-containing protein [Crocinitomicaceae bacterium]